MKSTLKRKLSLICTLITVSLLLIVSFSSAQDKTADKKKDRQKLYSEIAGEYELDVGERILPFTISVKEKKLYFDPKVPGVEAAEMKPHKNDDMKYDSVDPNGNDVTFTFVKNKKGKFTGCTVYVPARDREADAVKLKSKVKTDKK